MKMDYNPDERYLELERNKKKDFDLPVQQYYGDEWHSHAWHEFYKGRNLVEYAIACQRLPFQEMFVADYTETIEIELLNN